MQGSTIRRARLADAPRLNEALRQLSETMGDTHRTSDLTITESGFGPTPSFYALLAEQSGSVVGVAVFSPLFSTTRGKPGAYISDIWVAPEMRGQQLGVRLLAAVRDDARRTWGAGFIRLSVYDDNARAKAFYQRLGFKPLGGETSMTLDGQELMNLEDDL